MKADTQRGLLYSTGEDRRICILDVNQSKITGKLKTANSRPKCLALDFESKRLFAATNEGLILVLDISLMACGSTTASILLVHTIDFGRGFHAKSLEFDPNKNLIFCLLLNQNP
jgi:hypothetical protein